MRTNTFKTCPSVKMGYTSPLCKAIAICPEGFICTSILRFNFGHQGILGGEDDPIFTEEMI